MRHLSRSEERLQYGRGNGQHVDGRAGVVQRGQNRQRTEHARTAEVGRDENLAPRTTIGEDGEPGRKSGRDDEPYEGDDADGCDAVRLVRVDGDRDRGGTACEVRACPGQLQPAKVCIPKDSREERPGLG